MGKLTASLILFFFMLLGGVVHADEKADDIHPQDEIDASDQALSCVELDAEISRLLPLTYNVNPAFYDDPANGLAIWGSVFWAPAIGYLGYSGAADYYDQRGVAEAEHRIAVLRELKAKRRCYQR